MGEGLPVLRDYQEKAVADVGAFFKKGGKAALCVLFTGGGKTSIASDIVSKETGRVFVLAHRRELIEQAAARLRLFGVEPGIILAGEKPAPERRVQVGSVFTLIKRLAAYEAPDLIIIDEAHRGVANTYADILKAYPKARVLGLTATPCRLDGKGLKDAFQEIIMGPDAESLIERGYLMRPVVYSASVPDLAGVRTRAGDFAAEDLAAAIEKSNIVGDSVKSWQRYAPGRSTIAFCANVKHAEMTAAAFNAAGIMAEVLTGETAPAVRAATLARLRSGETKVLSTVDVLTEGFDFEGLECVIFLRPTKSLSLYLQMGGRVVRAAPGKPVPVILDHAGNTLRHGMLEEAREWSLEGQKVDRKKTTKDGESVSVRHCPVCFAVHLSAPVCPLCGHEHAKDVRVPLAKEGELKLLSKERLQKAREEAARKRKEEERGEKTLQDWIRIGEQRGYKNPRGWAFHRFKARSMKAALRTGYDGWSIT